jgi:lipopolysaccharide transport system ATP-binding protein
LPTWSSDLALEVAGLGKSYRVGDHRQVDYRGMHQLMERAIAAPFRLLSKRVGRAHPIGLERRVKSHDVWALRDVGFQVKRGEVLGILGHNGAGKSVLLKILSRVTRPTVGIARIRGRVGSMLEAGAGFHPELTGRENVFLSGAILGMTEDEIARKFDEIVDFSGIDEYLDTPVKRYSSGMGLRLAFSVAAHLETDIMLVDEVLAVGDDAFRHKCVTKMRSLAATGRTVLFVSHDLEIIPRICDRAILLESGRLTLDGSPEEVVARHRANTPS